MNTSVSFFVIVLLALTAYSTVFAVQLSQDEKNTILRKHNEARCAVSPAASNMARLVWDSKIEQVAQRYADSCPGYAHNGQRSAWYAEIGGSGYVGENLAWGYDTAGDATDAWIDERTHYKYQIFDTTLNAAGCDTGNWSGCGHYTQIIWANTVRVGCARITNKCDNIGGGDWFYVCNYVSGGNYVGQFPYPSGPGNTDACSSLNDVAAPTTTTTTTTTKPTTTTTTTRPATTTTKSAVLNDNNLLQCRTVSGNYVGAGVFDASSSSSANMPSNIGDGNSATFWAPATSNPQEWVQVSLNGKFSIDKVRILFQDPDHTPSSVVLAVKISANSKFQTVKQWDIPASSNQDAKAVLSFNPPIQAVAFKIKVLQSGTKKTQISEFVANGVEIC